MRSNVFHILQKENKKKIPKNLFHVHTLNVYENKRANIRIHTFPRIKWNNNKKMCEEKKISSKISYLHCILAYLLVHRIRTTNEWRNNIFMNMTIPLLIMWLGMCMACACCSYISLFYIFVPLFTKCECVVELSICNCGSPCTLLIIVVGFTFVSQFSYYMKIDQLCKYTYDPKFSKIRINCLSKAYRQESRRTHATTKKEVNVREYFEGE